MPKRNIQITTESSMSKKMCRYRSKEAIESNDDEDVFGEFLFQRPFTASRESYLKDNWTLIRNHLKKYNLLVSIKFKKRVITLDMSQSSKEVMFILRGRYLLKLLTFNIPFSYSVRILRDDVHVSFIRASSMFENQDNYYRRRHRLLEPDIRTLTYIELFTNCNVLLDQKTIILLGAYRGVKVASRIVWDTFDGNYHPIEFLRKFMAQYVHSEKKLKINFDDWNDYLSKFPSAAPVNENTVNDSSDKGLPENPGTSMTHVQEK